MMLLRHKRPDAEITFALPAFETYRRLVDRTERSFLLLGFGVYLIGEDATVSTVIPQAPAAPSDHH